jgi:hypothetical protein
MFPTRFPTGESGTVLCVIPSHMFFHCLNFSTSRPGAFSLFSQFASLVLKISLFWSSKLLLAIGKRSLTSSRVASLHRHRGNGVFCFCLCRDWRLVNSTQLREIRWYRRDLDNVLDFCGETGQMLHSATFSVRCSIFSL